MTYQYIKQRIFSYNKIKKLFLDLVYPKFCLGCGLEGDWVCKKCLKKIVYVKTQVCPECQKVSIGGEYCVKCRYEEILIKIKGKKKPKKIKKRKPLQGIIVSCYYEEGPVKELVHNFKYNNIRELGEFLSTTMEKTLRENFEIGSNVIISATPLHWFRKQHRGYNQAELLAQRVSEKTNIPYKSLLIKKNNTKSQVKLRKDERRENLKNVFRLRPDADIIDKTIILVDDVTTTGTTLQECARVLRENGAEKVWGLVVARG